MARRRGQQRQKAQPKPDERALYTPEVKSAYLNQIELNLNSNTSTELPSEANKKIIECLITAAETSLPKVKKKPPLKELWKDDLILNEFLDRRKHFERGSEEFKNATKLVKSRVRKLKNEKFRKRS